MTLHVTAAASPFDFGDVWPRIGRPCSAHAHIFQTAELLQLWCATIGKARRVAPLFLRIDDASGEPVMLAAFGLERRAGGVRVLSFLDGGVSDYNAPVLLTNRSTTIAPDKLWRALRHALPSFDVAILDKMPELVLGGLNPLSQLAPEATPPSAHVIQLHGDWPTFVRTRLHRPKDSRRKMARLEEHGKVRLVVAQSAGDVERLFPLLIEQKTRRYLEINNQDGFARPGYRDYFRAVTSALFSKDVVHLSALEVEGEALATHWGLLFNGRFYSLMLAYADHPLSRYSPGRLLIEHLMEWCFARGLSAFDLGVGDMEWKQHFRPERTPLRHLAIAANPVGWTYLEARKLRDELRLRTHPDTTKAA